MSRPNTEWASTSGISRYPLIELRPGGYVIHFKLSIQERSQLTASLGVLGVIPSGCDAFESVNSDDIFENLSSAEGPAVLLWFDGISDTLRGVHYLNGNLSSTCSSHTFLPYGIELR